MSPRSGKRQAKKPAAAEQPVLREPTPAEAAAVEAAKERIASRPKRPRLVVESRDGGLMKIRSPHSDQDGWQIQLTDAFGTSAVDFMDGSMVRLANAVTSKGQPVTEEQMNGALALMAAIDPQNELEAALGELIVANHAASMDFMARARMNAGEYRDSAVAYTNMATKTSRTVGTLVESLAKLRTGGRQRIEVIYVNGPAVIGDRAQAVIAGQGGGDGRNLPQPYGHELLAGLAAAGGLQMRGQDQAGDALQITSAPGPEEVSPSWRPEPWRTDGTGERQLQARLADQGDAPGASGDAVTDQGGAGG